VDEQIDQNGERNLQAQLKEVADKWTMALQINQIENRRYNGKLII
jgi:hypothetical protein